MTEEEARSESREGQQDEAPWRNELSDDELAQVAGGLPMISQPREWIGYHLP